MLSLSVIICTHNPRKDYLTRVLDALRRQSLPLDRWELLLVDNGSTVPVAPAWNLSWHPNARHIREDELGLTPARLRGIREATADLLIFVDDDNALDARYLEIASTLATEWPKIGVFGGSQVAAYEQPPDDEILAAMPLLAVRTVTGVLWTNIKGMDQATPRGAGLCLRRHLAVRYAAQVDGNRLRKMLDRTGRNGLLSGGDTDMAWSVCDAGYGMLVTPDLTLTHYIDKDRLDPAYLLRIAEGHGASGVILSHLHGLPTAKSALIDHARDVLRIFQATGLFGKRLIWAGLKGRGRGFKILRQNREQPLSFPDHSRKD